MVQRGELQVQIKATHRAKDKATDNLPWCTSTESADYFDANGTKVARCHQYRRSDGKLVKKPDPKELVYKGVFYRQVKGKATVEGPSRPKWYMRIWGPIRCLLFSR